MTTHSDTLKTVTYQLQDEAATLKFAQQCAKSLKALQQGMVCYLEGSLGAGKTTLVRGILQSLGVQQSIKSPTYTLLEPYQVPEFTGTICHMDLYRLADPEEVEFLGVRDYLAEATPMFFIEWPTKGQDYIPKADIIVTLEFVSEGRRLSIQSYSAVGDELCDQLSRN